MKTILIDPGAWALAMTLQLLGLAADPKQIVHGIGSAEPLTETDLLRAAGQFPVKVRAVNSTIQRLHKTPLPALAMMQDGSVYVIGKVATEGVLCQSIMDPRPIIRPWAEFQDQWSGRLILISRRALISDLNRRFDLLWFWGAINKYRNIIYEVLIASFFIQIFALITPLIFQVIIDKVLVHRGLSTLEVLAAGLAVVSLFDVILTGLRSYLFTHTSNRIDVELGARVFKHLLALPLAYFQARRVGDSVARVREIETVRQFLTGSAITLVIDVLFGSVFLGVMFLYSTTLAWIIVGTIPLYLILAIIVTPIFRVRLEEKFARGAENQAFLVESVTGVETIKAMAVEAILQRKWEDQLASYVGASFRTQVLATIANQLTSLISKATTVLTLLVGARLVINNDLTVGELVAFNMLAGQVVIPPFLTGHICRI